MKGVTRRQFLRSSSLGLGLGLAGGLAGCAASMKGDFAPKSGRRVVVIGGGWGGASSGLGASSRRGSGLVTRTSPMKRNPLRAMVRTSRWSRPVSPTALRTALIREVSVDSETIRPSQT